MPDNYDAFGDIREAASGVFGEEQAALQPGLKRHRAVHAQCTPSGVLFQFECQVCGTPTVLDAEYPEIVAIKYGGNPAVLFRNHPGILHNPTRWEWVPDQNGWRPDGHCKGCNAKVDLVIEPEEPERFLAAARRRGFINPVGEQQISQICAQAVNAGQAIRR